MKPRVIYGKRYNVNTANLIGEKDGLSLYRKKTGEYFATKNDEYIILRKDKEKLMEIAKELLSEKEYMYEFGIRDSVLVNASLSLPKPIHDRVAELADKNDSNIKETITELLFERLF